MKVVATTSEVAASDDNARLQEDRSEIARDILLRGQVQGFGVRPAIARLAADLRLNGFVSNTSSGVRIHVQGLESAVMEFIRTLPIGLPAAAKLLSMEERTVARQQYSSFKIWTSDETGSVAVDVPTDLAMCGDCQQELETPEDRRFQYAFGSCTNCGPRYSITRAMPWERASTSMADFGLCAACEAEFVSSRDRRFHAQTVSCPNCGPQLTLQISGEDDLCHGYTAIARAAEIIRSTGILAIKGIGGYQLVCDATSAEAVHLLRQSKHRGSKPLAVMVRSCDEIGAGLTQAEAAVLQSSGNPIVVLENVTIDSLAANISPGLNSVGVFLPTTPLHALLINAVGKPLVVTSGNVDSDPLVFDDHEAAEAFKDLADAVLQHDRRIVRPIDDSVVRVMAGRTVTIRAARGIAPLRLPIETTCRILAVGGEQKVALALSNGRQVVLGPHIGDMKSLAARERFSDQATALQQLYGTQADIIVHDLHPDYFTTHWAKDQGCRIIGVQHHHAHVVAGMVEHEMLDEIVLGIAFDGTGFGANGTIWGGEFLLATTRDYRRIASLKPFVLPGGEAAIREPWRIAVALLVDAAPELSAKQIVELTGQSPDGPCWQLANGLIRENREARETSAFGPQTSSMGRLFDAVASLVLGKGTAEFEGQLAMLLESACGSAFRCDATGNDFELTDIDGIIRIDWRPVVRQIVRQLLNSAASHRDHLANREGEAPAEPQETADDMDCMAQQELRPSAGLPTNCKSKDSIALIALNFHESVARMIAAVADRMPNVPIVLSGGCFQNRVLSEMALDLLHIHTPDRIVAMPGEIPPNDGGLAAGQIAIAAALLDAEQHQPNNTNGEM